MEGWPNVLACIFIFIAFLIWVRKTNLLESGRQVGNNSIWKVDLLQFRFFRKISALVCFIFVVFLLGIGCLLFGVIQTIVGFIAIFVLSRLYDWYESWLLAKEYDDWETSMQRDGWYQVSENRWVKEHWDPAAKEPKMYVLFTDQPIPRKSKTTSRGRVRRRSSYVILRKSRQK